MTDSSFFVVVLFNVAFKYLTSYLDDPCLQQWYFDQCAATQECHAADTGHDTPPRHSIQTRGQPVVLSFDVEGHTGIHNYPFECHEILCVKSPDDSLQWQLRKMQIKNGAKNSKKFILSFCICKKSFPTNTQLYDGDMVIISRKLDRKCTVPTGS